MSGIFGGGGDWLKDMLDRESRQQPRHEPGSTRSKMSLRQECAEKGHKYQVHGKSSPTKVACSRCLVSWAIGPRTEPAE